MNNWKANALFDSGSQCNLISETYDLVDEFDLETYDLVQPS